MNTFSGYIEVELKVSYSEEKQLIPFKFGSNAYSLFCGMHDLELWEIAESGVFGELDESGKEFKKLPDISKLRDLFFCAHQAAMRSKGKTEMVTLYEFGDILDETPGIIEKLQSAVIQSKILGFDLSMLAKGAEVKKK